MIFKRVVGGLAATACSLVMVGALARAQNAVVQRWPADDAPEWLLAYAPQKPSPDPFGGTTFKQPPAGLPAESGFNYTFTPYGGYLDAGNGVAKGGLGGASGTVAFPVGHSFGLISGLDAGTWDGASYYDGGSMLYWRDPSVGLLGVAGGGGRVNALGGSFGGSALKWEGYLGRFTPFAAGGALATNVSKPVGTASVGLAYYPIDNLQLSVGFTDIGGLAGASGSVEYLLPQPVAGIPTSLALNGFVGNHGVSGATAGLHFMIGSEPANKTLIQRRREDDPATVEQDLFAGGNNAEITAFLALLVAQRPGGTPLHASHACADGEFISDGCSCPPADVFGPQCSYPSDIGLKRDIVKLGDLAGGIGLYRYRYLDSDQLYVGVMAQEVAAFRPDAVALMPDGYHLRVLYARLGIRLMTWDDWLAGGSPELVSSAAPNLPVPSLNDDVIGAACYGSKPVVGPSLLALRREATTTSFKHRNCQSAI